MQKMNVFAALLAIVFICINSAFVASKTEGKEYGFMSATRADDNKWHYVVVDIAKLNKLKAIYSCDLDGEYCQVNVDDSKIIAMKRSGANKEIIEFDSDPRDIKVTGRGFRFAFSYD